MAANPICGGITNFGKRVVNKISTRDPTHLSTLYPSALTLCLRRDAHTSQYEKNPDEQIHSNVVPDEVIQPQTDKYWAPDPQTGVFGPSAEHTSVAGGERGFHISPADGGEDSVLEQKAWFRPTSLEDLEKPVEQ